MTQYKVNLNEEKSWDVESQGSASFLLDGETKALDIADLGNQHYHVLHKGKSFRVELLSSNDASKEMSLRVNGKEISLQLEDRFDILLDKLGMNAAEDQGFSQLNAPMPGLVLEIPVSVGQAIAKDEPLIVLEAMKMENVLKSPADVVVKSIGVEKGQAVEKNELLIEFES